MTEEAIVIALESSEAVDNDDDEDINAGTPSFWPEELQEEAEAVDLTDFAVQVSTEFLTSLGLQKYIKLVEDKRIGINALAMSDSDTLLEYGITSAQDRATILAEGSKVQIVSSPPIAEIRRPVKVQVRFEIIRLTDINTVDLTARLRFFLLLYWIDER